MARQLTDEEKAELDVDPKAKGKAPVEEEPTPEELEEQERLKAEKEEQERIKAEEWETLDEEEKHHRTSEDPYKSPSIQFFEEKAASDAGEGEEGAEPEIVKEQVVVEETIEGH